MSGTTVRPGLPSWLLPSLVGCVLGVVGSLVTQAAISSSSERKQRQRVRFALAEEITRDQNKIRWQRRIAAQPRNLVFHFINADPYVLGFVITDTSQAVFENKVHDMVGRDLYTLGLDEVNCIRSYYDQIRNLEARRRRMNRQYKTGWSEDAMRRVCDMEYLDPARTAFWFGNSVLRGLGFASVESCPPELPYESTTERPQGTPP